MANNPLVGAWELVSDSSDGILIYTGSHYSVVGAPKDRRRSSRERATPVEALEAMPSCQARSGAYCVDRNTTLLTSSHALTSYVVFCSINNNEHI